MAENNNLCRILKELHRNPCSQSELCEKLQLSKSHIHGLISNLITPGLIEKQESQYNQEQGRPKQLLKISSSMEYCSIVVIHSNWEFKAYLFVYGYTEEVGSIALKHVKTAKEFSENLNKAVNTLCTQYNIKKNKVLSILVATQGTIEQGCTGIMYRNNNLEDINIDFAMLITQVTNIKTYVYNFAYGHLLALQNSKHVNTDSAMALLCGEGSVALGIFLDKKILLGRNNSFPECSHLPYSHGFEKSLGKYGKYTEDALLFAIESIAPVYNLTNIIVAGSTFDEHLDTVYKVSQTLKSAPDPLLHNLVLEYHDEEIKHYFTEFIYKSFDNLVDVLNPKTIKRDLEFMAKNLGFDN